MCYAHAPTPCDGCNHNILQTWTNTNHNFKKFSRPDRLRISPQIPVSQAQLHGLHGDINQNFPCLKNKSTVGKLGSSKVKNKSSS